MKKCSIISPCYNGEFYVQRFLNSLLEQTYSNVEFIFINDGSTDNTEKIFMTYKPKLEKKGWSVIYIYQKNAGQAAALNKGLEVFTGDYLIFPDSDDILYPEHIAKKIEFMEKNPDYGFAFCTLDVVNENDLSKIIYQEKRNISTTDTLFYDLIERKNIVWPPIGNIIRSKNLLDVIPSRHIYEGNAGQNFQILLPMAHKFKAGYIDQSLGKYVIRKASHSRQTKSPELFIKHALEIWINTILSLKNETQKNKCEYIIKSSEHFYANKDTISKQTIRWYLFNIIPFIKIKQKNNKTKVYLFGFIPILKIK